MEKGRPKRKWKQVEVERMKIELSMEEVLSGSK